MISKFFYYQRSKKKFRSSCCSRQSLHAMQKQAQINCSTWINFTWASSHIARLVWLIQEYLFLVKKVIRTNTENSVEVGLFVPSISFTHLVLFIQIQSNSWPSYMKISKCVYIHMYTFCLKLKILYEDVKVICKVMCSLVKQNVVCWFKS